jgi:large subunit ribosomal protein L10e
MGLRPAHCYTSPKKGLRIRRGACGHARYLKQKRPYTRIAIKVPDKNYIGASPALVIRQFNMGNPAPKYDTVVDLKTKAAVDIRDNAIESVRQGINRKLVKDLGKDGYFMKVRVYPSNLMRENKQAQGAGADRVSQGMTQAFGIPIGRCARVRKGKTIFSVLCFKAQVPQVREGFLRAKSKFPCQTDIVVHSDIKSVGTLPSKLIEEKVVAVAKVEGPAAEGAEAGKEGAPAADAKGAATDAKGAKGAPAAAAGAKGAPAKPEATKKK